jgi:hypothetical protein
VQVRVPARLARVPARWEVVRVRRATEMVEFQSWPKEEKRERRRRERGSRPTTRRVRAARLLAPLIGGVKEVPLPTRSDTVSWSRESLLCRCRRVPLQM